MLRGNLFYRNVSGSLALGSMPIVPESNYVAVLATEGLRIGTNPQNEEAVVRKPSCSTSTDETMPPCLALKCRNAWGDP